MNILVTGGAGFIGSHVVDAYIENGNNVIVIDNLLTGNLKHLNNKAKFYELDIRSEKISEVFRNEHIDVINHHAAQIDVRKSVTDPIFDASVNIIGALNLFECAKQFGVKKIIFASTGGAIYGEQDYFPADEEHPLRPVSPYGVAKLCTEKYLYYYKVSFGIEYVILRYSNVYGPRQNPHGEAGVVAIFCDKMLKGEQPIINGDGKQTRDYVYVSDVVRANLLALQYEDSDVFNVSTGVESDVNTIFYKLRDNINPSCAEVHGKPKVGEQKRSVISFEKIKRIMGWSPIVQLDEGLKLTAEYFKKQELNKMKGNEK